VGIIEWIKDRWLTWRTGKDRSTREWEAWYEVNVVYRASSITNMFQHFKHVIEVDSRKFIDHGEPFAYVPCEDARQYFWPSRPLGENCVWRFERVMWDNRANTWYISGLGDTDMIFVATNNDDDAVMVSLKFT
jgi:hypothetical protein